MLPCWSEASIMDRKVRQDEVCDNGTHWSEQSDRIAEACRGLARAEPIFTPSATKTTSSTSIHLSPWRPLPERDLVGGILASDTLSIDPPPARDYPFQAIASYRDRLELLRGWQSLSEAIHDYPELDEMASVAVAGWTRRPHLKLSKLSSSIVSSSCLAFIKFCVCGTTYRLLHSSRQRWQIVQRGRLRFPPYTFHHLHPHVRIRHLVLSSFWTLPSYCIISS